MMGFALFAGPITRNHPRRHPERAEGRAFSAPALGMNYAQAMRSPKLPQAFRNMVPLLLTRPSSRSRTPRWFMSRHWLTSSAPLGVGDRDGN